MFSLNIVMAAGTTADTTSCNLGVTLLNQDPYPAVPGDYVKLVFQVDGLAQPDCSDITFNLLEDYPIKFDPGKTGYRFFNKVDYVKDYKSSILIPYEVRIDKNALDGANPVEISVQNKNSPAISKTFNLEVKNTIADFEVYVKNYDYSTKDLTLEILNTADVGIEALTVEIPKQNGITIKGPNRIVVGDLDSNEYTTADFEATPKDGNITLDLTYSDSINVRRTVKKQIGFDSSYFVGRASEDGKISPEKYIILGIIAIIIIWIIVKKVKKSKKKRQ